MEEFFREEEFYKDNGYPSESLSYCSYIFYNGNISESGEDYDQFALVDNALYPYIRLTKKRGMRHFPCGHMSVIATDGHFARMSDEERNMECPKIAWGFAAMFLANLRYDMNQEDYIQLKGRNELVSEYYNKYLNIYLQSHNGLKFFNVSDEQKEFVFLEEHEILMREFWKKSIPLKSYSDLYKYASNAESDYESFLRERRETILNKEDKKSFSTNNKESGACRIINQSGKGAVYIEKNTGSIIIGMDNSESSIAGKNLSKNEAIFNSIADQIIKDLDGARVSIHVAIAWFTNQRIADKLVEKFKEGLDVKVVYFRDHTNCKFGVDIDNIPYKAIRGTRGGTMHNKFCVIDNQKVITGSYNWSENAENKNDENAAVVYDNEFASDYSVEFKRLFASAT